jgi:hypothetical protein
MPTFQGSANITVIHCYENLDRNGLLRGGNHLQDCLEEVMNS